MTRMQRLCLADPALIGEAVIDYCGTDQDAARTIFKAVETNVVYQPIAFTVFGDGSCQVKSGVRNVASMPA